MEQSDIGTLSFSKLDGRLGEAGDRAMSAAMTSSGHQVKPPRGLNARPSVVQAALSVHERERSDHNGERLPTINFRL